MRLAILTGYRRPKWTEIILHLFSKLGVNRLHIPQASKIRQQPSKMASTTPMLSMLRRPAPRLTRNFFTCHCPCRTPLRNQSPMRLFGSSGPLQSGAGLLSRPQITPSLGETSKLLNLGGKNQAKLFPKTSDKSVAYWLLGSAASVFGIVVFGGLTRLTESGYKTILGVLKTILNIFQIEYYGMETSHRVLTATRCSRLGCRVHQVPLIARI